MLVQARAVALGATAALALGTLLAVPTEAATAPAVGGVASRAHPTKVDVLLHGLDGAKPLNFAKDGNILFAQAGPGTTGVLQRLNTAGRWKGKVTTLTKLPGNPSDVASGPDTSIWVLFGAAGGPEAGPPT
ncbi:MAG: hypothetical protein ABI468_04375, partial [Candidatus Nanopelagicales bacterium]